jgi:hypothetical protein
MTRPNTCSRTLSVLLVLGPWLCCAVSCDDQPGVRLDATVDAEAGLDATAAAEAGLDAAMSDGSDASDAQAAIGDAAAAASCMAVAPTSCPEPGPRYDAVAPIFERRCVVCHNGSDGMWPLSTYQHVADWYGEIRSMMLSCGMPPVDSGMTMELEERQLILSWIRCGFPR